MNLVRYTKLTDEQRKRLNFDDILNLVEADDTIREILDKALNRKTIRVIDMSTSSEMPFVKSPWEKTKIKLIPVTHTLPF